MFGLMMDVPLLVSSILRHAARVHADTEIVSRDAEGRLHRETYAQCHTRASRLAHALRRLGLAPGDRVGTLAWNGFRHLELYYGVSGAGFVIHTINPRLFPEQIAAIVTHANDSVLCVDPGLLPLVEGLADRLPPLRAIVVLAERSAMPASDRVPDLVCYEELIGAEPDEFDWPQLDEATASGLCYTSGTTGAPKGVLYSHRSSVLQAMAVSMPDAFGIAAVDTVMPAVPMFHVNAWSLPYAVVMAGAKLVLPGPRLDGASLHGLILDEEVTMSAGVPTIWMDLLAHAERTGTGLGRLRRVGIGGSACPPVMIERFRALGVEVVHAWGMTETSPVGVTALPKHKHRHAGPAELLRLFSKQGRPFFGVEIRVVGPDGADLPFDGASSGRLLVRGPWVAAAYYDAPAADEAFGEAGWFDTGDVATVDADGFIEIVDRTKDVIKSGGEWISSIALENIAVSHPAVREAAVVARPDPRWGERPVLFVVLQEGAALSVEESMAHFEGKAAKWCIPTDLRIVDVLPHTATGKLLKSAIRAMV